MMKNISLSFSQEEVTLILRVLGVDTIPGVDPQPFDGTSKEGQRHLLASAKRTLQSRRMIAVTDDNINIDRTVLALISTCIVPAYTWLVTCTSKLQPTLSRFYHISPSLFVEHMISAPGIHTFTAVTQKELMIQQIIDFCQFRSQGNSLQPQVVSADFLQRVCQSLRLATTINAGNGRSIGQEDNSLAEQVLSISTIAMVDRRSGTATRPKAQSFGAKRAGLTYTSFLQLPNSLWQTVRRADQQIELHPVEPNAVRKQIERWLAYRLNE